MTETITAFERVARSIHRKGLCGRVTPNIFLLDQHGFLSLSHISTSLASSLLFALYPQNLPRVAQLPLLHEVFTFNSATSASNQIFPLLANFISTATRHPTRSSQSHSINPLRLNIVQQRKNPSQHHQKPMLKRSTPGMQRHFPILVDERRKQW